MAENHREEQAELIARTARIAPQNRCQPKIKSQCGKKPNPSAGNPHRKRQIHSGESHTTGHSGETHTTLDISGQVGQEAKPEAVRVHDTGAGTAPGAATPVQSENQQRQRQQDAKKAEQDLVEMIIVLRRFLGNAATNADWQRHMQNHGKAGWSKSAFDRRLRILKAREWIRIVGDAEPILDRVRVSKGSLFEATEKAPGASTPLVSDQYRDDHGDIGGVRRPFLERGSRRPSRNQFQWSLSSQELVARPCELPPARLLHRAPRSHWPDLSVERCFCPRV